jgi:hypothetical protein
MEAPNPSMKGKRRFIGKPRQPPCLISIEEMPLQLTLYV